MVSHPNNTKFCIDIILKAELNQLFRVENAEFGVAEEEEESVMVNRMLQQGIWGLDRTYCEDVRLKCVFQLFCLLTLVPFTTSFRKHKFLGLWVMGWPLKELCLWYKLTSVDNMDKKQIINCVITCVHFQKKNGRTVKSWLIVVKKM